MKPGVSVIMSLPRELVGVPVEALLEDVPPRLGNGYDLRHAKWLVRRFSFSFVISARQFVATRAHTMVGELPFAYLGVGAPQFDSENGRTNLASLRLLCVLAPR